MLEVNYLLSLNYLRKIIANLYVPDSVLLVLDLFSKDVSPDAAAHNDIVTHASSYWIHKEISVDKKSLPIFYVKDETTLNPVFLESIPSKLSFFNVKVYSNEEHVDGDFVLWVNQPCVNTQQIIDDCAKKGIRIVKVIGLFTVDEFSLSVPISVICTHKELEKFQGQQIDAE